MKKNKYLVKFIFSCLTACIILGACELFFTDNDKSGNIIINLSFQQERSIIPTLAPFEDYEISFESRDGKIPPPALVTTGTSVSVSLDTGNWVIRAAGRISIGGVKKATAEGSSGEINIVSNINAPVTINLYAKLEGDNGTISYNKSGFQDWPAAESAEMKIISKIDDTLKAAADLLSLVDSENPGYFSLEPGYYLLTIKAVAVQDGEDPAVREASISEDVLVYSNTETLIPFTKDDFTFAPQGSVDSIVLYPRGQLNTYVGVPESERIQFSAEALRADGSVINDADGFVFSGVGVNSSTGVFTPQAAGNVTVTVSLDGKTASSNVTVHAADYMRQPYFYSGTGKTYNGFSGTEGNRTNTSVTITYPYQASFEADGFFTLEGTVNNPSAYNYAYIRVRKGNGDPTDLETAYFIRNNFKTRIWLRFGPGDYTIQVWHLSDTTNMTFNLNGDGDLSGRWSMSNSIVFNVTNTRDDDLSVDSDIPDKRFIYPSYVVQSDDFAVTNLAAELTYGLTDDTEKIKAIHDYIVKNSVYDNASLVANQRKKQDALTVLGTRYFVDSQYNPGGHFVAVCEGYANTFAALARAAGIEVRYISSTTMNHGWNHAYANGAWKFMDVTWNDPLRANAPAGTVDFGPDFVRYNYFMLDTLNGDNNSHTGWAVNQDRSLIDILTPPWQYGVPEGWY